MGPLLSPRAVRASCALWGTRCSSLPCPLFRPLLAPSVRSLATFELNLRRRCLAATCHRSYPAASRCAAPLLRPFLFFFSSFLLFFFFFRSPKEAHAASLFAIIDGDRVEKFSPVALCKSEMSVATFPSLVRSQPARTFLCCCHSQTRRRESNLHGRGRFNDR